MSSFEKVASSRALSTPSAQDTSFDVPVQPVTEAVMHESIEYEGTTTFALPPTQPYRYSLSLKSGKLRIWLENCDSKKQWCTADLVLVDYVNPSNYIPDVGAVDYIESFHELLNRPVEDASEMPRSLQNTKDDRLRLEFSVKIQALLRPRVLTYAFNLEPISVERVDIIEAKVRDLQDEVKALRVDAGGNSTVVELQTTVKMLGHDVAERDAVFSDLQREVKLLKAEMTKLLRTVESTSADRLAGASPTVIQLEATALVGDKCAWSKMGTYTNGSGVVTNLEPGTYLVVAIVNYKNGFRTSIVKGTSALTKTINASGSSTLTCTTRMKQGEELSVVFEEAGTSLVGTSYLTLTRLGE